MKENIKGFFRSFTYAAAGVRECVKKERNMRFHLCAAVTVILWSLFYELTTGEYCALFLSIGFVIGSEVMNTAIEAAVNVTEKVSPLARTAKDCGAGAVLISAVTAVCCGIALFGDGEVLRNILDFFTDNPLALAGAGAWVIFAVIFIFGKNTERSIKENEK
ncbi:MAG: diacylglycerol kinase family protein [Oscillospiraceae bacterium]|nr:diacylglycerol kinase family protein [Oscillospiraceae bacterium]